MCSGNDVVACSTAVSAPLSALPVLKGPKCDPATYGWRVVPLAACCRRAHRHLNYPMWRPQVLEALQAGAGNDALVCCAGYILGEYGRLVANEVPTHVQFALLQERFLTVSNETKVRAAAAFAACIASRVYSRREPLSKLAMLRLDGS